MNGGMNEGPLQSRQYVAYLDLSGGRNTKKDPHALDRNQLAASDNTLMLQGNTIAKRPGSVFLHISAGTISGGGISGGGTGISAGGTGFGISMSGMVEGRFANITTLVVQAGNQLAMAPVQLPAVSTGVVQWISIGGISGGTIQAAQLFDPQNSNGPDGTLFITTGKDVPLAITGIGRPLKPVTVLNPGQLPTKADGSGNPITPAYCATLFSSMFYAGEPTDPSMLFISDPFRPESFTNNLVVPTGTITGSTQQNQTYIGLPVGRGDGVGGGAITALAQMGSAMIVYKQSAIYAVTQMGVMGDMVWGASVASSSVGCVAPRSIVPFDTFHCFLGIDGVYIFDGSQTIKISANNPDLFDGSFSPLPLCVNRQTAIGVRFGNRYIIFFDDGGGNQTPLGYCNRAAWFDFDKPDADGLPCVGTWSGMNVGGVAALRGPFDAGNFAWCSATSDLVGSYNAADSASLPVFSDFGAPINVTVAAKADFFVENWGEEAPLQLKVVDSVEMLMSFPTIYPQQTYVFNGLITYDQLTQQPSVGTITTFEFTTGAVVGTAIVGTSTVAGLTATPQYDAIPLFQPAPSNGLIVQYSFSESSINPWTSLGFVLYVNNQLKVGVQSG